MSWLHRLNLDKTWKKLTTLEVRILPGSKKELQIIPNPTNGVFSIGNLAENAVVEVYEMNGKKIFSKSIIPSETIDLRSFGKGTYLVEIQISNSQQKRLKLVSL